MQTVINNYIVNSTIIGSTVLQGSNNNNIAMLTGNEIGGIAGEVLRIFMTLDLKRKAAALAFLYDLEDGKGFADGN